CDNKDMDGKPIPRSQKRKSYSYAMKMRAMFTSTFQKDHGLGKVFWHQADDGIWRGNPSVSNHVSGYMVNLRRSKVRAGETSQSVTAITPDIIERMYQYSTSNNRSEIRPYETAMTFPDDEWGSPRRRIQVHAIMLIAMWCLLRSDEVVRITFDDLCFCVVDPQDPDGPPYIELRLKWRKTSPFGWIKPFRIYMLGAEDAWFCPVRALANWINVCGPVKTGPLFRPFAAGDRPIPVQLQSETFLEWFRNLLVDVDICPFTYGTHSFRRGGCQFLHVYLRWSFRKIADWGGWSTEYSWHTIITYLINWSDPEVTERAHFLHPTKGLSLHCGACGRTCRCNSY
ncbi:hypothetical protein C8J57DRAFT_1065078, partial [Mycena rebaudengoi]